MIHPPVACVVDASVGIKLVITEALSNEAHARFARLAGDPAARFYVPDLFDIECANTLWKQVQRSGYPVADEIEDFVIAPEGNHQYPRSPFGDLRETVTPRQRSSCCARRRPHHGVSGILSYGRRHRWAGWFGRGRRKMADSSSGGFEYRGHGFRFQTATCTLEAGGYLHMEAVGRGCGLRLVGVPLPGAAAVEDLPGRTWEPNEDELARHADVFAEGGLTVRDKDLWIMGGRIACTRFDSDRRLLGISFRLVVQDGEHGCEDEADGVAYCQVQ